MTELKFERGWLIKDVKKAVEREKFWSRPPSSDDDGTVRSLEDTSHADSPPKRRAG